MRDATRDIPLDPRHGLVAGALVFAAGLLLALLLALTGWDTWVANLRSPLPDGPIQAGIFLAAALTGVVVFLLLVVAITHRAAHEQLPPGLVDLVGTGYLVSRRATTAAGIGLALGTLFSIEAAWEREISPWLWAAATAVGAGALLPQLLRSRTPAQAPAQDETGLDPSELYPDVEAWWQSFLAGPHYHGQASATWNLPPLRPSIHRTRLDPPIAAIMQTLLDPGEEPYSHVALVARLLADRSGDEAPLCVVDLPDGCGFTTMVAAVAIESNALRHQRVLVLVRSMAEGASLQHRLSAALSRDARWRSTIRVERLHVRADFAHLSVDTYDELPHILIADAGGLDLLLRGTGSEPWRAFISGLGLVVLTDVYGLPANRTQHTAMLLRRLALACRQRGAVPAMLVRCTAAIEQYNFLSRLLARTNIYPSIVSETDAPSCDVSVIGWLPNHRFEPDSPRPLIRRRFSQEIQSLVTSAMDHGLKVGVVVPNPRVVISDLGLTGATGRESANLRLATRTDELPGGPGTYDVLVFAGTPETEVELRRQVTLLGARRGQGRKYAIVVATAEPGGLSFLRRLDARREGSPAPTPALDLENPHVMALHLRAQIGSGEFTVEELGALDPEGTLVAEWLRTRRLATHDTRVVPAGHHRWASVSVVHGHEEYFNPNIDMDAGGEALTEIRQRGLQEPLDRVDTGRALRIACGGAILVLTGQRYDVQLVSTTGRTRIVEVSPSPARDVVTHPLGEVSIAEASGPASTTEVGTTGIVLDVRSVRVTERIEGYRKASLLHPDEPGSNFRFSQDPLEREPFEVPALTVATAPGGPNIVRVLHTVGHALRVAAHAHVRFDEEDLGMHVLEQCPWLDDRPALVLYDSSPGGMGIVQSLRAAFGDLSSGIWTDAFRLLRDCPCVQGCDLCIANPACRNSIEPADLDKLGALRLIGALIGPEEAEMLIKRRTQPNSDASYLAELVGHILDEAIVPMLGLTLEVTPGVQPNENLSSGRYNGRDGVIEIGQLSEQEAAAVLTHQLAHAWMLEGNFHPSLRDPDWPASRTLFEEGFARWVEGKVLDRLGFHDQHLAVVSAVAKEPAEIGLRLFSALEEDTRLGGVASVVRFAQEPDPEWLHHYLGGVAYRTHQARVSQLLAGDAPPQDWVSPEPRPSSSAPPPPPVTPPVAESDTVPPPMPTRGDVGTEDTASEDSGDAPVF